MSLIVATPVRGAELSTALVSLGYSDFRVALARDMPDARVLAGSVCFALDVVRARNRIAGMLLGSSVYDDVSGVLWVDDDVWPERGPVVVAEMVELATSTGAGVVGAPYTNKQRPVRWTHRIDPRPDEHGEPQLLGVGFGFTLTTMSCLRDVASAPETRWYADMPRTSPLTPNVFGQLEDRMLGPDGHEHTVLLSEDYSFCRRARRAGQRLALHLGAGRICHAGGHAWSVDDITPGDGST